MAIELWQEGCAYQGGGSDASLLGKYPQHSTLIGAIGSYNLGRYSESSGRIVKRENGRWYTPFGCEVFASEAEARRSFG